MGEECQWGRSTNGGEMPVGGSGNWVEVLMGEIC